MAFTNSEFPIAISRLSVQKYLKGIDSQDLDTGGSGSAYNASTSFNVRWQLMRILIHFDAAYSGTLTVSFDSADGSNYDTVLSTQTFAGSTDVVIEGDESVDIFQQGEELNVQLTAGAGYPTAYITVIAKEIP